MKIPGGKAKPFGILGSMPKRFNTKKWKSGKSLEVHGKIDWKSKIKLKKKKKMMGVLFFMSKLRTLKVIP